MFSTSAHRMRDGGKHQSLESLIHVDLFGLERCVFTCLVYSSMKFGAGSFETGFNRRLLCFSCHGIWQVQSDTRAYELSASIEHIRIMLEVSCWFHSTYTPVCGAPAVIQVSYGNMSWGRTRDTIEINVALFCRFFFFCMGPSTRVPHHARNR